jgi:sugar phosphate isomerase/epimerase
MSIGSPSGDGDRPELDRRAFLRVLPAALGAAALTEPRAPGADWSAGARQGGANHGGPSGRVLSGGWRPALDALGVQLYTLRDRMPDDVEGTLEQVAAIGYREVELAGLYGRSPAEMRRALDTHGLRAASSHHSVAEIRGDWQRTLEAAVTLGQALIVVPSIPGPEQNAEGLRRIAGDFDRAAEAARAVGLRFGYHNHAWEFEPLPDGTRPMDLLLERTDGDLVDWQMDIFWTVHGGADPARYLRRSAGRVTSVHVKDRSADGRMVDVGDGVIDFSTLLPLAEGLGLLHAFVEHDTPGDSIESVRRSYEYLTSPGS